MKISDNEFTPNEIKTLEEYRDRQKDKGLKIRFIALLMLAHGTSVQATSSIVGVCEKTIENWYKQYRSKGVERLNNYNYKPKKTYLSYHQICQVVIWVIYNNPINIMVIQNYIRDKFGVSYCAESVRQLIRKYGLKTLYPKVTPVNPPTVEKQKEFINKYNEMKTSADPGSVILFGDGMHLIHQNIPGRCWGDPSFPPVMETNSGRKRLNILGAYNLETHSLVHLTGEENCNAIRVIEFFEKILKAYPNAPRITVILDNARYFHAKLVTEWLENHPRLKREFLPAYAPNLNLIERFWRFAKSKLVKNRYYVKYKTFRATVFQFLNHTDKYKEQLKTLMVENFEIVHA